MREQISSLDVYDNYGSGIIPYELLIICYILFLLGGSQSSMANQQLSLIEVESMLREKIRANFAEIKQVCSLK